ncbi:hypothetical protein DPEC_G00238090 [Dallia pectoralis]|uniref:Uncharacterized protein n=1 Tax=Dallia pectoralis TaxID=75939 RepID=A0ACC2FYR2_DALPE|nr:hypothetical protein DPEC_G00238090 [Dallia pectoralis]
MYIPLQSGGSSSNKPSSCTFFEKLIIWMESFDMVHDSLNPTLADWRMASSDNMDEVQVWKRHDKQRAAIESLMESNLEKETNHGEVTQSLQDLSK